MRLFLATIMIAARFASAFRSSSSPPGGIISSSVSSGASFSRSHTSFSRIGVATRSHQRTFGLPSSSSSPSSSTSFTTTARYMSETIQQEEETTTTPQQQQSTSGYQFATIEPKWQKYWKDNNTFATPQRRTTLEDGTVIKSKNKKKYVLDMFPYPSGAGLHVGHPEGYTGTFIYIVII